MTLSIMTLCTLTIFGPVDDCIPERPPIREMPLLITYFDPALEGHNCDGDCSHMSLAPVTVEMYGYAAACPAELVGVDFTAVISHPVIGTRACLDRGGLVVVEYSEYFQSWVVIVDLLESSPPAYNYSLLYGWVLEWTAVSELVG